MFKSLLVFKKFAIQFVRSLTLDEREVFRFWCQGIIPESKLDANLSKDGEMLKLIVFLCNDAQLSFNDLSLLRSFLSSVNRYDILEKLEPVELRITVGSILEDYIKSVNGSRQTKLASRYKNNVEFLATTREGNQELISSIKEVLSPAEEHDDNTILENLDSAILDSQLSWRTVVSSLLIIYGWAVCFVQPRQFNRKWLLCQYVLWEQSQRVSNNMDARKRRSGK